MLTTPWTNLRDLSRRQQLLLGLAVVVLAATGAWVLQRWGIEETDNAQLEAHLVDISSRVAGMVLQVPVQDDQQVAQGALLAVLDPRDAAMRLQRAQADLDEARQQA